MKQIDYTVVIPAYNCAAFLRVLIDNIQSNCRKYRPQSILIVDDGSCDDDNATKFVANIYSSSSLPIRCIPTEHRGPLFAEQTGLDAVNTDYAVVMHSDTRLLHKFYKRDDVHSDTLSVLASYISQVSNAVAIAPFTMCYEMPNRVQTGPRALGIDKLPYSYYRQYEFDGLKKVKYNDWKEIYSCDNALYIMRMSCYNEIRFDEAFAPYLYYHDDFFARARLKGFCTYITQDVIAFHPRFIKKPENSLSIMSDELYQRNRKLFLSRWTDNAAWTEKSFKQQVLKKELIEGKN